MPNYVLWIQGLLGPEISILHGSPHMGEYERRKKLAAPVKIDPEHETMGLEELEKLYPAPPGAGDAS